MNLSIDDKRDLCGHSHTIDGRAVLVTLDGKKATISGAALQFAVVGQLPKGTSAEFCWETVLRILNDEKNPGSFRS